MDPFVKTGKRAELRCMDDALKSHINRLVVVGAVEMWATGALAVVHISTAPMGQAPGWAKYTWAGVR